MINYIVFAIFVVSIFGVIFIIKKNIESIITLPEKGKYNVDRVKWIQSLENNFNNITSFFRKKVWLQKTLSSIRVLIIKLELSIDRALQKMRSDSKSIDDEKE